MSPALDLGVLNALNDDVVVEVDVEEALKSSIFIVQKAAAPKCGVEFRQDSIAHWANSARHTGFGEGASGYIFSLKTHFQTFKVTYTHSGIS